MQETMMHKAETQESLRQKTLLFIVGTRPEAIKMAPLIKAFQKQSFKYRVYTCVTGQHREMLDQVLELFSIEPDWDLNLMRAGQSLNSLSSRILEGLDLVYTELNPDWVFVHGDTTTSGISALAAFHRGIDVAHVEAGLRSGNLRSPFPEEMNRRLTARLAKIHFAPTLTARDNLIHEGIRPSRIFVTGNTVVDALFAVKSKLSSDPSLVEHMKVKFSFIDTERKLIFVTGHRRENLGEPYQEFLRALACLAKRSDVQIVFPVHMNPQVHGAVEGALSRFDNIHLMAPVSYFECVYLMGQSHLIITDSGGIQEEGPSLGVPVLVTRKNTERPEALESGSVRLTGMNKDRLLKEALRLLDDISAHKEMSQVSNPYGDGRACARIVSALDEMIEPAISI